MNKYPENPPLVHNNCNLFFPILFFFTSMFFSCNEATEDFCQIENPKIGSNELTADDAVQKNQLAEAAKIVAEIVSYQKKQIIYA